MTPKFKHYGSICWGLLVAFVVTGALSGKTQQSGLLAMYVATLWVLNRIFVEAIHAIGALYTASNDDDKKEQ